jgi:uncharacterized membrane protein YvbJ
MSVICSKCQSENTEESRFCSKCGAELPEPKSIDATKTAETRKEEPTTGITFAGRYQIIE